MDMGLSELPAIRKLLPFMGLQVPGSQSPQHRTELLCFLPMVLLKGQAFPRGVTRVPAGEVILWGRSQKCISHLGEILARFYLIILDWELGLASLWI